MSAGIKPVRVVCDTNILVSALLGSPTNQKIYETFKAGHIILLFSKETLAELAEVLGRPKFKIPSPALRSLFRIVRQRARIIRKVKSVELCRDPKDNMILGSALSGKADFLVTGDKDILAVSLISDCQILTPSKFLELFQR